MAHVSLVNISILERIQGKIHNGQQSRHSRIATDLTTFSFIPLPQFGRPLTTPSNKPSSDLIVRHQSDPPNCISGVPVTFLQAKGSYITLDTDTGLLCIIPMLCVVFQDNPSLEQESLPYAKILLRYNSPVGCNSTFNEEYFKKITNSCQTSKYKVTTYSFSKFSVGFIIIIIIEVQNVK